MDVPETLRYREFAPPPALRPWARCVWMVEGVALPGMRVRVLPDGCVDLIIEPGRDGLRAHWVGPQRQAMLFPVEGPMRVMGLRLRPGAAGPLLRLPAAEITDGTLDLDAHAPGAWRDLQARLANTDDFDDARDAIAHLAAPIRGAADASLLGLVQWLERLRHESPRRVGDLSACTGLTARTLERRLRDALGLAPREYLRFLRFEHGLRALQAAPERALAEIALDAGYADQAHYSREFRRHVGLSPRAWRDPALRATELVFESAD